jgi:hypothetical protein
MVLVGDRNEIDNTYRKSYRIEGITILDSFSHAFGLERKWITEH